jgi:hypothetical protein
MPFYIGYNKVQLVEAPDSVTNTQLHDVWTTP